MAVDQSGHQVAARGVDDGCLRAGVGADVADSRDHVTGDGNVCRIDLPGRDIYQLPASHYEVGLADTFGCVDLLS
jgi:hypothetical protein